MYGLHDRLKIAQVHYLVLKGQSTLPAEAALGVEAISGNRPDLALLRHQQLAVGRH